MNILLVLTCFIIAFTIVFYYERKIKNLSLKLKNNVHFYVARDKDGSLYLYMGKPSRSCYIFSVPIYEGYTRLKGHYVFKYLGLNEDDYDNLKWEDEPVEVFLNMENK